MNIVKWFKDQSFFKKMTMIYVIFAVLPMIFVTAYNYIQTSRILQEKSYQDMQQNMETTGKSLETFFESYSTIMDLLYTNQTMYNYLGIDYTELSYGEMFYYTDRQLLHNTLSLFPSIHRIRFYSDNDTLPRDNYYFYQLDQLPGGFQEKASKKAGSAVAGGIVKEGGKKYAGLIRKMNYYSSGGIENYLVILVDTQELSERLLQNSGSRQTYLIEAGGQILAASDVKAEGRRLSGFIPEWRRIADCGGSYTLEQADGPVICMSLDVGMGMKLVMTEDQESLLKEAEAVTRRIRTVFAVSSLLVFGAIYLYGRMSAARVDKVVYAAKRLGDGQFDYILRDMGGDEIGQIAGAFNLLNERIQILIQDNYEKKLMIKSSEMNLLQEQINPHFLYNALSVISSMSMRENGKRTVECLRYLADFYRISLNKGREVISIEQELDLLQNYMKIQKIRFGEDVVIRYEVDEDVLQCRTIKLILQPLVENAIHHGRREEEVLTVGVSVRRREERVIYEVCDDGLGIEPEKLVQLRTELKQSQEGYGLKNVDIRVKLRYGEGYGVSIMSIPDKGTCVRVEIPAEQG
jgi:two-component system sensor histidine kinase YesM|nr:sensor histidine kinase [uncultured Schaedlerella sp.]